MGWFHRAFLLAWELPQNVLGAIAFAGMLARRNVRRVRFERERWMVELEGDGAVSLGLFVFFSTKDNKFVPVGPENRDHEYGHALQSRLLGPMYLPVVGVPSVVRVAYAMGYLAITGRRWSHYYDGWPERWADELGRADIAARPNP
jgi:hypothetical protein